MKRVGWLIAIIGSLLLVVSSYINYNRSEKVDAPQSLVDHVRQLSSEKSKPAVDARIDRVWKAIPGYDGYRLNIQKTVDASRSSWNKDRKVTEVYTPVKPLIQLRDLPAEPIYRGNPQKPMISFMINVAWGNEHLPSILETLRTHRVQATFFLDGSWLAKHETLARQILDEGHELSNHAYSHKNMSQLSTSEATAEIVKTEKLLKRLGIANQWFAPPSGDFDEETVRIARGLGLFTVLWTIDTVDWRKPPSKQIVEKVDRLLEPGALILMHPTKSSSEALPAMIASARKKKLRIGSVRDLISSERLVK